ncbi:hypothetical protein M569_03967, partial [Genlisea aurea]
MNCFPCFGSKQETHKSEEQDLPAVPPRPTTTPPRKPLLPPSSFSMCNNPSSAAGESENLTVKSYTFRDIASATKNFRQECLLGEGGFGKVFKGMLQSTGQTTVAIKQLDRNRVKDSKEFVVEVSELSLLVHQNVAKLVGYCADGDQRLLVYEYIPCGSLKNHLLLQGNGNGNGKTPPLDWSTRMKIALGIAQGLEYLHDKGIIHLNLKSSNILLDEAKNPRLSEYGLSRVVQSGNNKMHVVSGYGYSAPEYERNGESTSKADVYSFGVILLELITGRMALGADEQNLVGWVQPILRDPSKYPDMADPHLRREFAVTSLNQAVGVAAMCLQEEPSARPLISDISAALSYLAMAPPEAPIPSRLVPILSTRVDTLTLSQRRDFNNNSKKSTRKIHSLDRESSDSDSQVEDEEEETGDGNRSGSDFEYSDSSD